MEPLYEYEIDEMVEQVVRKVQRMHKFDAHAIMIIMKGGYIPAVKIGKALRVPHWYQFEYLSALLNNR